MKPMEPFVVNVDDSPSGVRIAVVGELDRAVVSWLDDAYRLACERRPSAIVIDLVRLEFCDLGAQRSLLRCHADGASLVGNPPCLQRLFELTGQAHLLPATPDGRWAAPSGRPSEHQRASTPGG